MGEPAQEANNIDCLATEGLDQIFDVVAEGQDLAGPHMDNGHTVTLAEAAELLSITRRSALRLIHEGKLDGAKTGHGQWLVKSASINTRILAKSAAVHPIEQVAVEEAEDHGHTWPVGHGHDQLIKELVGKVEILTYRNGYLESQLSERQREIENHKDQIKLLTDSQYKAGWWRKTWRWLIGG